MAGFEKTAWNSINQSRADDPTAPWPILGTDGLPFEGTGNTPGWEDRSEPTWQFSGGYDRLSRPAKPADLPTL